MDAKSRKEVIERNLEIAEHFMQQVLANPSAAADKLTVIPLAAMAGGKTGLTPSRLALLIELRSHGEYGRMHDLAKAVGRDKFAVSKDIDVLADLGLVHKQRKGRTVAISPDTRPIMLA